MTTFSAPELCVPRFFSSQKLAYHYFCSVWEGLIRAYHYVCNVFICFFGLFRKEMYENTWFPKDLLKNGPWNFHHGFQSYSSCNFSFFGPDCGPPPQRDLKQAFCRGICDWDQKTYFFRANCRYAAIRLEKATIFIVSDWLWQGLIRAYHYFCSVSGAASAKHRQAKHSQT